jgi:chromate transporter
MHLTEIFKYFFRLGWIAFGGPAAHISMMERDLVDDKKWLTRQEFLDYIGITNLIPGPNSTELTMHCGHHRGGLAGLFVAGFAFITPAVLLTGLIAYLLSKYGTLTYIEALTEGFKVVVLVIIAQACYKLFNKAAKSNYLIILSIIVAAIYWFYPNEIILLICLIGISMIKFYGSKSLLSLFAPLFFFSNAVGEMSSTDIFLSFLKIGAILFGSGYVLFAYLDTHFVQNLGILTTEDLMEAVAIGQFTPGPVLSTSTYIGYLLNDFEGAIWATLGIFLPAFFFVMITSPFVSKIRKHPMLAEVLDAVNIASLAFMIVVTVKMAMMTLTGWQSISVLLIAALLLFKLKWNTISILLLGGGAYLVFAFLGLL